MTVSYRTLDVRPTLRSGGEPFQEIMQAVSALAGGQGLRLIATFKPVPLFSVMQKRGFTHSERPLGDGDWEVTFTPDEGAAKTTAAAWPATPPAVPPAARQAARQAKQGEADASDWPAPVQVLDNRGLMPPEPLVRTLEAMEELAIGEVLEIWNDRDPVLLYPELETRGHLAHRDMRGAEGYRILIRKGEPKGGAS
ncbi:MAG TPA: DUF2249 domain-containing protein [Parvibaculum sp.]|uniref:DUF2249 domain-containing protein n=1 Tax=Parvibaculum sp. TaxID=2024848 RepID=UPI002BC9C92D|nr:DUF2249 domain-containing protein [Parvibaculum sp.]HMM15460.1 DUF2249 domain-containing protein [Parvibaculum sp.]